MIRQVGKGAANRIYRGIAEGGEHCAAGQSFVCHRIEIKLRATLDRDSLCSYLVGSPIVCIEFVGVGAVGFESECVPAGQDGRLVGSNTGRQKSAAAAASTDGDCPGDDAFASQSASLHVHAASSSS